MQQRRRLIIAERVEQLEQWRAICAAGIGGGSRGERREAHARRWDDVSEELVLTYRAVPVSRV